MTEVKRGRPPKSADADHVKQKTPKPSEAMNMFRAPLFPQKMASTDVGSLETAAADKVQKDKTKQSFGWSTNPWGVDKDL